VDEADVRERQLTDADSSRCLACGRELRLGSWILEFLRPERWRGAFPSHGGGFCSQLCATRFAWNARGGTNDNFTSAQAFWDRNYRILYVQAHHLPDGVGHSRPAHVPDTPS